MRSYPEIKVLIGAFLLTTTAFASAAPEPEPIKMGANKLIPTLSFTETYNDNIFSQNDKIFGETSSWIGQLEPEIEYLMERQGYQLSLSYAGDYGFYHSSSDDDYDDHTFSFNGKFTPTDLYSIDFGASAAMLHDNRGEGASEGAGGIVRTAPDEYDLNNVNFLIDYGRESAKFGVELEASLTDMEYTSNRLFTQFRDRQEFLFGGRFYGRASGKTRYFVEYLNKEYSYSTAPIIGPALDNTQDVLSVGATWDITGKTTGTVKIGRLEKDFDVSSSKDGEITVWDVDISWAPKTYSVFYFSASKDALETNGTGTFIEAENITLTWLHAFSERLSTTASIGIGDDEFENSNRQDDRTNYGLGLYYDWKRWLGVAVDYSYTERDSNFNLFDFERNLFAVRFDMTL